jgi:hypothetical protein
MNIQRLPVTDLKPAPYNPRVALKPGDKRFEALARSLKEFDLVQPLVWNSRTGHLVGGHQRLEVLRSRGYTEIDCVVVDLPLEREKALNVALNNAEVGGDWDTDKLGSLLTELAELPDFDATLTGFDEKKLHDLMFQPTLTPDDENIDEPRNTYSVMLEIPPDNWPAAQNAFNKLLQDTPEIRLHVIAEPEN